jgi:hypothetical protein
VAALALGLERTNERDREHPLREPLRVERMGVQLADRFWAKVDRRDPDECWPWLGGQDGHGYGAFWIRVARGRRNGRMEKAHRTAYFLTHGEWPVEGMHSCDYGLCCNPAHIQNGTHAENLADMRAKGRYRWPGLAGENHPNARLSTAQVLEIRRRYVPRRGVSALAAEFGVTRQAITQIGTGKWRRHG